MKRRSSRFTEVTTGLTKAVSEIPWEAFGNDHGHCLPIAVFGAAYFGAAGIDARPVEAGVRIEDPLNVRWAEIDTYTEEPALQARNEKGLDFLGHIVIHLPTYRVAVDVSLPTQRSTVMMNLPVPDCLIGDYDHTKGHQGFIARVGTGGRGKAIYHLYPKRDGWRHRRWPYDVLREMGRDAFRRQLGAGLYEVEWNGETGHPGGQERKVSP